MKALDRLRAKLDAIGMLHTVENIVERNGTTLLEVFAGVETYAARSARARTILVLSERAELGNVEIGELFCLEAQSVSNILRLARPKTAVSVADALAATKRSNERASRLLN